ncbi:MAG: hypothetical protein ACLTL8_02135 [Bifidobacterium pseudocatenulatum]
MIKLDTKFIELSDENAGKGMKIIESMIDDGLRSCDLIDHRRGRADQGTGRVGCKQLDA